MTIAGGAPAGAATLPHGRGGIPRDIIYKGRDREVRRDMRRGAGPLAEAGTLGDQPDSGAASPPANEAAEFNFDTRRLRRPKKAELIADEIRRSIVRKHLNPGDRLPNERQMIDQLHSSRGTVREALKILEAQGLIEVTPGVKGGARVASISYEAASFHLKSFFYFQPLSWAQVYDFREQVEPRAAALATPHLTEADLRALEDTIERCRQGMKGEIPLSEHRVEEGRFHRIIAYRCPNPMLRFGTIFVNDMLVDFTQFRNVIGNETHAFACECLDSHLEILAALRAHDAEGVAARLLVHIRTLKDFLSSREQIVDPDMLLSRQENPDHYDPSGESRRQG